MCIVPSCTESVGPVQGEGGGEGGGEGRGEGRGEEGEVKEVVVERELTGSPLDTPAEELAALKNKVS